MRCFRAVVSLPLRRVRACMSWPQTKQDSPVNSRALGPDKRPIGEARMKEEWIGAVAVSLSFVSTAAYFAFSQGLRAYAIYLMDSIEKMLRAFGIS